MTPVRAIQILHRVWGNQDNLNARECSEIMAIEMPGETSWSTLCRVAGIDGRGIDHLHPQAWLAVRSLCAQREIELAREGKYP